MLFKNKSFHHEPTLELVLLKGKQKKKKRCTAKVIHIQWRQRVYFSMRITRKRPDFVQLPNRTFDHN